MGYYTTFTLEDAQDSLNKVKAFDKINSAIAEVVQDFDECWNGEWDSYEKDLLAISIQNPEIAFRISGSGKNKYDTWWKDYLNGQVIDYWDEPKEGFDVMTNAKKEFLNTINKVRATVLWARFQSESKSLVTLAPTDSGNKQHWDKFLEELDYNYNSGWSGECTEGVIMLSNNCWFARADYDGSSCWVLCEKPTWG